MANIILIKNYERRPFSELAAKIAVEHFGWSEESTTARPLEVGTKTKPIMIEKPVKLKEFPIEKVNDDMAEIPKSEVTQPDVDSGNEVNDDMVVPKKTRKKPIKSKTK